MTGDAILGVLREIRDEIRQTNERIEVRFGRVESVLNEMAVQQRFVVRWLKAGARRDRALEREVANLERRVDVIESKIGE